MQTTLDDAYVGALYVHIPFCERICHYCDFAKTLAKPALVDDYLQALGIELAMHRFTPATLKTVYLGGGTPSCLDEAHMETLFNHLRHALASKALEEVSIECNPGDVTLAYARRLKALGLNRVSLGIQSFDERHLRFLGRRHDRSLAERSVRNLKDAGFDNIAVDLLFAIPGQTLEDLHTDLQAVLALDVEHISYYHLSIEKNTRLHVKRTRGEFIETDEDLAADMYETLIDVLVENGYDHYEISNFAKPGKTSRHNMAYWRDEDYLGVGCAAHSKVDMKRWFNHTRVRSYIDAVKTSGSPVEATYPFEGVKDALMMGLRLSEGVDLDRLNTRYRTDALKRYPRLHEEIKRGLLVYEHPRLRLGRRGMALANCVFAALEDDEDV